MPRACSEDLLGYRVALAVGTSIHCHPKVAQTLHEIFTLVLTSRCLGSNKFTCVGVVNTDLE